MLTEERLAVLYEREFGAMNNWQEISDRLEQLHGLQAEELRGMACNEMLYHISMGYTKYEGNILQRDPLAALFCRNADLLPAGNHYFNAVAAYFRGKHAQCLQELEQYLEEDHAAYELFMEQPEDYFTEDMVCEWLFEPFKGAFPGFWSAMEGILSKYPHREGIAELCGLIGGYYDCDSHEEALERLFAFSDRYPALILPRELAALTYCDMKYWKNALALFEELEDKALFLRGEQLYVRMAWCYGMVKERAQEEACYRRALELAPEHPEVLNNLGYCLYTRKKYAEALELLERCLAAAPEHPYAANNILRVLMAQGEDRKAREFAGKDYKISPELKRRAENMQPKSCKSAAAEPEILPAEEPAKRKPEQLTAKRQQFSSEKLLEDELTARIESGTEVFGLRLQVYRRKGVYGRQFRIPVGRLDLLCEDEAGNLYVIELKKDAGYDDAYAQTAAYLDWFASSGFAGEKQVYGIICLNSPTRELLDKVHADKRMRVFEYQISYTER